MSAGGAQTRWMDAVIELLIGCIKISLGCKNCLSCASLERKNYPPGVVHPSRVTDWDKIHTFKSSMLVGVCMSSDMFLKPAELWWKKMYDHLALRPDVAFLALTKRLKQAARFVGQFGPLPNLLLGTSAENQKTLDESVPLLYSIPARGYILSLQPLLGPVDISKYLDHKGLLKVIAGAEMGPNARPCETAWIRQIEAQCQAHGIPYFLGQYKDENGDYIKPPTLNDRGSHALGRRSYRKTRPDKTIGEMMGLDKLLGTAT
jgi:protein gp37